MPAVSVCSENDAEAKMRVDVAACYRLLHLYGLSDFTDGFVSARVQPDSKRFLVGGYGLFPEFAEASNLYCRSLDENPGLEKTGVDLDAFRFTQMAFASRLGINACIHAHPKFLIALSAIDTPLLPMSQWGIMYGTRVAYMDFTTTEVTEEVPRIEMSRTLAGKIEAIILRNHGVLVVGKSIAQSFFTLHRLELACELQLAVLRTGAPMRMPDAALAAKLCEEYWTMTRVDNDGSREWPGLLAKLDRLDSSYRR